MCAPRFERPGILVVGCRTGRDLFSVRATHSNAHVTALDRSTGNLAYAIRKCNEAEMYGIEFIAGDLLDVPPLGWTFDFIECPGGMSRLPEPNEAVEALARCTTPGSVLRLEVCSDGSRRVANALQSVARERGLEPTLSDLRTFRNELVDGRHGALPQVLLESPEFHTASGLRSILFDANEPMLDAPAWIALVGAYGFDFLCAEANDVLLRAASAAGYASAADWSLRDWERFERTHPAEFGGRYSLWFARE
jgi:SAM-dependent methyltransferase